MRELIPDVRHAMRGFLAKPGFAVLSLLTLTLGIGATSAIFTLVNAIVLRPLPYRDPGRLVTISDTFRGDLNAVGNDNYDQWRASSTAFEEMALRGSVDAVLSGPDGEAQRVRGADVTASMFRVLGVEPAFGRVFGESDEFQGENVGVIVITHGLWLRMFGGRQDVVGQSVAFNGRPVSVIGVLPQGFWFANGSEFFVPMRYRCSGRGCHQYDSMGRLKAGVSLSSAQAEMSRIAAQVATEHPEAHGWGVWLSPLADGLLGPVRTPLTILSSAVGLLLLVACGNLTNLLLVRGDSRTRELAVRAALGASRARLARAMLFEAVILAGVGAAAGGLLGTAATRWLAASMPSRMQLPMPVVVDVRVVAFSAAAALFTTFAAVLVPLYRVSRLDLVRQLHASGVTGGGGRSPHRLTQASVVAQVSLASVLLVAGALLAFSLWSMRRADLGFEPDSVLTAQVQHLGAPATAEETVRFYGDLIDRVERMPGVQSAALTWALPLSGTYSGSGFTIEGRPAPREWREMSAQNHAVSPSFFRTVRIRVIEGRGFDANDRAASLPVAVINRALAKRHWAGHSPVGARILQSGDLVTVIGVVEDVRHNGPGRPAPPAIYRPLTQRPWTEPFLAIRADAGLSQAIVTAVRREVRTLDHAAVISRVETLDDALGTTLALPRVIAQCMAAFAVTAFALAVVGLYGAVAQWVGQRRHEIGVRLALGAKPGQVARMVVCRGMVLAGTGVGIGLLVASGATALMRSMLFGVTPNDARVFLAVAAILTGAAVLACLAPARRAAAVDPIVTLKSE